MNKKRGQIWIETVLYTLILLVIIGIVLAVMIPKLNKMKDKTAVISAIETLNNLNSKVHECLISPGNKRGFLLNFKKGEYLFDSENNQIVFNLRGTKLLYSQPNSLGKNGEVYFLTTEKNDKYDIALFLNYSSFDITYNGEDSNRVLNPAPTAYNFFIEYLGGENKQINIEST